MLFSSLDAPWSLDDAPWLQIRVRRREPLVSGTRKYPSIAVLIDYMNGFAGGYEEQLRLAFTALAERRGIEIFVFYGRGLDDPNPIARTHNAVFTMASSKRLDGMILLSSSLSAFCGPDRLLEVAEQLQPLPLVSVALELPGIPSVVIDSEVAPFAI